jgi:sugar/nucleoside kinase (ribokinase family)
MHKFDVTLAGEFNLDLLMYGLPQDIPVEREVLADRAATTLGGSPAITAHNLASLGTSVGFATRAAKDALASICQRTMEAAGVDLSYVASAEEGSGTGVTVLLQHHSVRRMLTYPGNTAHLQFNDLDLEYLTSARHFHLSSYFLQTALKPDVPRLFKLLKGAGMTISLDTNDDPSGSWDRSIVDVLRYVDVLLPNEREACQLAHASSFDQAVNWILQFVPHVVVKQGIKGASAFTRESRYFVPAVKTQAVDAVGAGDSFNAGFLHGYVQGWPFEQCLEYGNLTGAWSTTAMGGVAAFEDRHATQQFLTSHALHIG